MPIRRVLHTRKHVRVVRANERLARSAVRPGARFAFDNRTAATDDFRPVVAKRTTRERTASERVDVKLSRVNREPVQIPRQIESGRQTKRLQCGHGL